VATPPLGEISPELDALMQGFDQVQEEALTRLRAAGLLYRLTPGTPSPPQGIGPISGLSNDDLGDLQGELATWIGFLGDAVADLMSERDETESALKTMLSIVRQTKYGTKEEREDKTQSDPRVIQAKLRVLGTKRRLRKVEGVMNGLDGVRKALSRYVEIRKLELEAILRGENVTKMRRGLPRIRRATAPGPIKPKDQR